MKFLNIFLTNRVPGYKVCISRVVVQNKSVHSVHVHLKNAYINELLAIFNSLLFTFFKNSGPCSLKRCKMTSQSESVVKTTLGFIFSSSSRNSKIKGFI